MRHGKCWAALVALGAFVFGCTPSKPLPLKDMVGYVPPTSLPAPAKRTLVRDDIESTWTHLIDFLERSSFEIETADRAKNLLVARYSGDPEPYIDCGSIVTHEGGILSQITGSTQTANLNYKLENEPVVLDRTLNLDSRIIVTLTDQSPDTVINTDTTYVVTKTIDIVGKSGEITQGNRETISFNAGDRSEFSKGTSCQPNGFLDLAVLESIPNIVVSDDIDRSELPRAVTDLSLESESSGAKDATPLTNNGAPSPESKADARNTSAGRDIEIDVSGSSSLANTEGSVGSAVVDWNLPKEGLPRAALPAPSPPSDEVAIEQQVTGSAPGGVGDTASTAPLPRSSREPGAQTAAITGDSTQPALPVEEITKRDSEPLTVVDETTKKLLDTLDCDGTEWHFCDLVRLTAPYRKRNITNLYGLTVNTSESFADQIIGSDLKLDFLFPSFPSYLHVAYARRDGTIDHVLASSEAWPADRSYRFEGGDQTVPGPEGLAMIVAIATDEPLFPSLPSKTEPAEDFINRLVERLSEIDVDGPQGLIAASQLLIYAEKADS